jgi:hypothetical protein
VVAVMGWALFVPPRIKTCPETGPCVYPPHVGLSIVKQVFPTKEACEKTASDWMIELDQRLASRHFAKVGPLSVAAVKKGAVGRRGI